VRFRAPTPAESPVAVMNARSYPLALDKLDAHGQGYVLDILIAALHIAADYRSWITATVMATVTAALVLLPPRPAWRASMAVAALLALANQCFGHRMASALSARHDVVVEEAGRGVDVQAVETSFDRRVIARSPRQAETAR
jgi:hypothetical protein